MKQVYLPMPVSFEQKREWNKKGFRVLDVAFMPDDYDNPVETAATKKQKPKDPPPPPPPVEE